MGAKGAEAFDAFYGSMYGQRWEHIKNAFKAPRVYEHISIGLQKEYHLDPASLWAASQLPLYENDKVLDACAAPGGKTLVLSLLLPAGASLVSSDRSPDRVRRLRQVVDECVTPDLKKSIEIRVANLLLHRSWNEEKFNQILIDAPCSSERHVYLDPKHLKIWSASRSKRLAEQQEMLLRSATSLLQPGGHLLYSTCSIHPAENDGVLTRWKKKNPCMQCVPLSGPNGHEKTEFGVMMMPDQTAGWGPLFASLWTKTE